MSTSRRRVAALLVAGALLSGACSDDPGEAAAENPKQAFADALDALAEYEGVTAVVTIEGDPDDLAVADTPPEVAEKVLNSSLTISSRGSTPEDAQAEIVVNVDGNEDAVELRMVEQSLYTRADVRELVDDFGGDSAEIEAAAEQFSAQGFGWAQALVDGEWIGIEGLDRAVEQITGQQQPADQEEAAAVLDQVTLILEQNASVASEGTDDVGAHLVVSVPVRETVQDLVGALQGIGGLPTGALPTEGLQDVPEGDIPIDVWIDDGRLVQLELDFVAIARELGEKPPDGVDRLGLRMTIDEFTDEIEAPADFEAIDLEEILQGVFGGFAGQTEIPAPPGRDVVIPGLGLACSDLQTLGPDEIRTFVEASGQPEAFATIRRECPELFE
ncbi:MAG: hypothetical protein M3271_05900 [Actinomycetota bacterium]|nr:hypothetical protein [Actinomycetota bacterium]